MANLTLGSLFDGSGGFPLGGLLTGIKPLWASEIEPFPIRVTTKRIPQMKHYGDISKLDGGKLPPVNIITFGSPCTDLSVAGKRAGLGGEESVLFYEAIRIIKEMRCKTNGKYPRYAVWENVPGAFSSNKGEDFKRVLESFIEIKEANATLPIPQNHKWAYADILMGDGWSIAYRVIDAQYFGVPQRRRRIFLVADFGGRSAGEILFEPEGLSRDFTQGENSWQGTAGDTKKSVRISSFDGYNFSVDEKLSSTIGTNCGISTGRNGVLHNEKDKVISFEPGATSRLGGHSNENLSGSLRACMGDNQIAVAIENHPADGRCKESANGKVQALTSRMGTGGNNVPLVMDTPKTLKIRSGCEGGGKGALIQNDKSATLGCNNDQTVFVPTVYGICSDKSNSMLSTNPQSGIYKAKTSRTLDAGGGNPGCNQGGMAVVALQGSMIGRKEENGPRGNGLSDDISFTLNTIDRHGVVYALDRETFNCGKGYARNLGITEDGVASTLNAQGPSAVAQPASFYPQMKAESQCFRLDGKANTLVNGTSPGCHNGIVETNYIVRRLTPTECARLQGFPDWWCSDLKTEEPTEEEISFWSEVWETHRKIIGKSKRPKTRNQIIKWLKNPHSDSAEYKMWGNGVALPCVCFVLNGIILSHKDEI